MTVVAHSTYYENDDDGGDERRNINIHKKIFNKAIHKLMILVLQEIKAMYSHSLTIE